MDDVTRRRALKTMAAAGGTGMLAASGLALGCSTDDGGDASGSTTTAGGAPTTAGPPSPPAELTGRLVYPDDTDYDEARQAWDRLFVTYPLVIVFAQEDQDVVNALTWCRQNDVAFRVRSGRHNLEGWSSIDGGVVIDVSDLNQVEIDEAEGTVTVGTGLDQGDVTAALAEVDGALPLGSEASVGIAGVTLGGGISYLSRSMGAACDNLVGVDLAVPSGSDTAEMVRATEDDNADLLWASRGGGGGNFGVATAFTFRYHELRDIVHFTLVWDWSDVAGPFDAWQGWAPGADARLGSNFVVLPRSGDSIICEGIFQGTEDELGDLLDPITSVGSPDVTTEPTTYGQWYADSNSSPRETDNWLFTSSWIHDPLPSEAIGVIESFMTDAPADACNYWCLSWGGETREAPSGGSAFVHRDPLYYAEPGAGWNDTALNGTCRVWISEFRQAMRPFVQGAYVNVPDRALADWGPAYYGEEHFERLRSIKAEVDPDQVFQFPQSIPPA